MEGPAEYFQLLDSILRTVYALWWRRSFQRPPLPDTDLLVALPTRTDGGIYENSKCVALCSHRLERSERRRWFNTPSLSCERSLENRSSMMFHGSFIVLGWVRRLRGNVSTIDKLEIFRHHLKTREHEIQHRSFVSPRGDILLKLEAILREKSTPECCSSRIIVLLWKLRLFKIHVSLCQNTTDSQENGIESVIFTDMKYQRVWGEFSACLPLDAKSAARLGRKFTRQEHSSMRLLFELLLRGEIIRIRTIDCCHQARALFPSENMLAFSRPTAEPFKIESNFLSGPNHFRRNIDCLAFSG